MVLRHSCDQLLEILLSWLCRGNKLSLRSNLYAFGPITDRTTDCFFSSSAIPFAAKKCAKRSTYCSQSSFPSSNSPILPNVAAIFSTQFRQGVADPILVARICGIVDSKYIIQQLGANELQAMAFYTQMIHSRVSRIFEVRYNGTY